MIYELSFTKKYKKSVKRIARSGHDITSFLVYYYENDVLVLTLYDTGSHAQVLGL